MAFARVIPPGALLLLAACTVGPDYAPPPLPASPAVETGAFLRAEEEIPGPPLARWWEALGDPQLTALIEKGLANAPAIRAAEARLRQARAALIGVGAAGKPALGASALYAGANLPDNALGGSSGKIDFFNLGFDAQWEVDLWGGHRRDSERAQAEAEASAAQLADAQVALAAEIARNYATLRGREASDALLRRRRALEDRLVRLAKDRFAGGTVSQHAVIAAQQLVERTKADQDSLTAEIVALRDGLAVLTGQAPGALDALPVGLVPLPPAVVAIGDPGAMLARRPDIRVAERRLAAQTARIGIESARRYPKISLMGLIGIGGTSAGDLVDASQLSALALPRLSWSFLDFGRTAAAIDSAEAGRDAALADYQASVLNSLLDAEAALVRYGAARKTLAGSAAQLANATEIARLQDLRADGGTLPQSDAIEAQRQVVDAELARVEERTKLAVAYVALTKALGLGWGDALAAAEPSR